MDLLVSVDDEQHMDRFHEVVEKVKSAGMDVDQGIEELGVVTGSIDSEKVESLRGVEGVSHVERSRQYQFPPPESEIQ